MAYFTFYLYFTHLSDRYQLVIYVNYNINPMGWVPKALDAEIPPGIGDKAPKFFQLGVDAQKVEHLQKRGTVKSLIFGHHTYLAASKKNRWLFFLV